MASPSLPVSQAIKPGTPIPGMDFRKDQKENPVVALESYPSWVSELATPQISLAKLRRMDEADATDKEKMRYLKLTRRRLLKENNQNAAS